MSTFASNHVQLLSSSVSGSILKRDEERATAFPAPDERTVLTSDESEEIKTLYNLLADLKSPLNYSSLRPTLATLTKFEDERRTAIISASAESEEATNLKNVLTAKILIGLYAQALDTTLKEACAADAEAEWWADIERSNRAVIWYLVATLPERLKRCFETIVNTLRARGLPLRVSSFTPQSIRQLFPQSLRPTALTLAFFPHLSGARHIPLFASPFDLVRQECKLRRDGLVELRNGQARRLGSLLSLRSGMNYQLSRMSLVSASSNLCKAFDESMNLNDPVRPYSTLDILNLHVSTQLPQHTARHSTLFASLRRPSRLTLMWPRLAVIPPLALIVIRTAYGSREEIGESLVRAVETLKGFWHGYLVEPIRGILDTVRTGGDESARIVNKEGVEADKKSLERMAIALTRDKLAYNQTELDELAKRIQEGDLTPVLEIYENDIKSPIRSAIAGSLVRSLLIQIQKAKVDLDQALSGIDRLLKSQELTFAFVGVAPSLTIVYVVLGYLNAIWRGGRGNKRYGGRRRREGTWRAIRRIDRLLTSSVDATSQPAMSPTSKPFSPSPSGSQPLTFSASQEPAHEETSINTPLPPLTSGLLLISVSELRQYAETYLPERSRLREGLLEDVADLESPSLGRVAKQRVVDRMWRSWGKVLGWDEIGRR